MAVLRSNPLLKWVLAPLLMLVVVVGFSLLKGKPAQNPQAQSPELTAEQAKALGVDGDTNNDTIRTLTAETKSLREDLKRAIGDNDRNREENAQLRDNLKNINQNVDQRLQAGITQMQEKNEAQTKGLFDSIQQQLNTFSKLGDQKSGGSNDMPVGLGIAPGDGQQFKSSSSASDLVWIDPQDAKPVDANGKPIAAGSGQAASGFAFPTAFGSAGQKALDAAADGADRANASLDTKPQDRKKVRKVYTLPQNSTLMGSISMTALIGRVPVDGTVNDPYPFKVLIGPDNLTANGIDLPDVAGAVASGTASGDWTLSCVRGQIRSLTFVFNDGRVRTLPMPQENGQNNTASNNQNGSSNGQPAPIQGGMGWISDPYGIPCISGERRSNASQYLGSQALITAAGAGAASLIKSDGTSSSYVSTSNGTIGTTGISGNEAMGKILGQGVSDISTWVNKLYGQAFAAIYVQPGAKVAIHLDQELAIDYELKGRKVDYRTGGSHAANNLD